MIKRNLLQSKNPTKKGIHDMKRVIYCFFVLLLCPALICGCRSDPPKRCDALMLPFSAEIEGELHGTPFTAKITGEGQNGELCIEYLSPTVLSDIRIAVQISPDGMPSSEATLTRGTIAITPNAETLKGLLLPLTSLVTLASAEAATLRRNDDGYLFTFADGSTLITDQNGIPKSLSSKDITYKIIWWER